jgi:hypothetical protein
MGQTLMRRVALEFIAFAAGMSAILSVLYLF